jgi:hypothetical protein
MQACTEARIRSAYREVTYVSLSPDGDLRAALAAVLTSGERGAAAADRLCAACLPLLGIDAAAISLIDDGQSRGTFGASDAAARALDALQFSCGEGPCLEATRTRAPVLVPDLQSPDEQRWPAFRDAAHRAGVRAVFAVPVRVGRIGLGALDLFRSAPGELSFTQLSDAALIAEAGAQILLDVVDDGTDGGARATPLEQWVQVASLSRIEVYQATGMIMAQLDASPVDALVRLRAYAFAHDLSAREVAQLIISRRVRMKP